MFERAKGMVGDMPIAQGQQVLAVDVSVSWEIQ
jgi:hypothetical protein